MENEELQNLNYEKISFEEQSPKILKNKITLIILAIILLLFLLNTLFNSNYNNTIFYQDTYVPDFGAYVNCPLKNKSFDNEYGYTYVYEEHYISVDIFSDYMDMLMKDYDFEIINSDTDDFGTIILLKNSSYQCYMALTSEGYDELFIISVKKL